MPSAQVALYTPTALVSGQIDPGGRRLSDYLNDRMTNFVSIDSATYYDVLAGGDESFQAVSLTLRKESVVLAVPEDRPDPLRPRVTTNALRIALGFDGFHVRGSLHRQPSDSTRLVELFSNPATRSFFAVSDARIRHLFNSAYDTDVSLVLVNTKLLQFWALEGDD